MRDTIEVGPVPQVVAEAARADAAGAPSAPPRASSDTMNAVHHEELVDHSRRWQEGQPAHVVNLTLLPLTPGDSRTWTRCCRRPRAAARAATATAASSTRGWRAPGA